MRRAVVIGSGPNGLAGAIVLAQAGVDVVVHEASESVGGGVRSAEFTLPGFVHDVCSSIHPLGAGSPVFGRFELDVEWIHPGTPAAHPLDDGTAVTLERGIDATAAQLGRDAEAYRELVTPLVDSFDEIVAALASPRPLPRLLPLAPKAVAGLRSARSLAEARFREERTRAWFAGFAAHSMLPLERRPSAGFGIALLVLGHTVGWPFPRGGSQRLADALAAKLRELGGVIRTSSRVDELPRADVVLADVAPRELVRLGRFPARYERALLAYRHGPGAFKLDWALDGPIPWQAEACRRAGTVHLGGTLDEIAASESAPWHGRTTDRPFVLLAQTSLFDDSRAPSGKHTAWAYCHVPNGSTVDRLDAIEAQVERFAPGFRDVVLARAVRPPAVLQAENRNYVGGDINGGAMDLAQVFARPAPVPYRTPLRGVYLCSSATPPGGGVHGLCGATAAWLALRDLG